jgi:electron transfer flavoprotein beta subunit
MKILVALKHVPDTETKVKVAADGVSLDEGGVKFIVSPYDEFAIEEALRIKEAKGAEVVVVSAGRAAAQEALREGLALGADRAIHVGDDRLAQADALARGKALASVARAESPDLILMGRYGVGTDEGQTGPILAELLDLPHVGGATKLELRDGGFAAEREIEGATEKLEGTLPAVVTCDKGLNEPRYKSLKGIMAAKKKTIETRSAADAGLTDADLAAGARVVWEALELPPARKAGRKIDGDAETAARTLVTLLREEAKVL